MDRETENEIFDGLMRSLGSPAEALEAKRRLDSDLRYALDHQEEWRKSYPNHWIAVYEQRLVATASSAEELRTLLQEQNLDIREVYLNFLHEKKPILMLSAL
jgi:hypothetical protein